MASKICLHQHSISKTGGMYYSHGLYGETYLGQVQVGSVPILSGQTLLIVGVLVDVVIFRTRNVQFNFL